MTRLKLYQVDAFSNKIFKGNPAAVCPLDKSWLPDNVMQSIAMENNLSETAFYIYKENELEIRWFTPKGEVDLCGHATLATAHVLKMHENHTENLIKFNSRSGQLSVDCIDEKYVLDFPEDTISKVEITEELSTCFNLNPTEIYKGKTDYLFAFNNENEIKEICPNYHDIAKLSARGIIITAKGTEFDFVSRFFAPKYGINEDPVTGSAYTTLVPYWSMKMNKMDFSAIQLSERQGILNCQKHGNRIKISGQAITYLEGQINI